MGLNISYLNNSILSVSFVWKDGVVGYSQDKKEPLNTSAYSVEGFCLLLFYIVKEN